MSTAITISVKDDITPFIAEWLAKQPSFVPRLVRSLAWYSQKRIKELSNDSRITSRYHERKPWETVRKPLAGFDNPPKTIWWGKLRRAIGYQTKGNIAEIGWTSSSAAMEGRIQEEAPTLTVTPNLRKYYAMVRRREIAKGVPPDVALKVPGRDKREIERHPRPLFEPATKIIKPEYGAFMQKKVTDYINGIHHAGVRKRNRRYIVYNGKI